MRGTHLEVLTKRSTQLLRALHESSEAATTYTLHVKQDELAKQFGISRQVLNVHLKKLRDLGYIRTGRGFIDITEKGLNALGISSTPAFILIKVLPHKRIYAYEKIKGLPIQRAFRIAGDIDAFVMTDREKLDEVLKKLSSIEGIQDTRSYVIIETIK